MGKSDPFIIPAYRSLIDTDKTYESVALLGFSEHNGLTKSITSSNFDFYDLALGNWNINNPWNIEKKYDLVVCTRCAYFCKNLDEFFQNISKILNPGGEFLIDWGLGDHWRFKNYKIGWVKDGEQEYAYEDDNFLWSTVWHDEFLKSAEYSKFQSWVKRFGYDSVKDAIFNEVPSVFDLQNLPQNIRSGAVLIALWQESPQLYIILKGKLIDENLSQ